MAPTRPATGGRPKNAWNSSRHRRLVRLHTLTTLNKEEIRMVLSSSDFNPCVRDIQKKLGALFPRDYGKDHHRYHPLRKNPSTKALMIQRFERLRRRQISKLVASSQDSRSRGRIEVCGHTLPSHQDASILFEGPSAAFRNYGGCSHTFVYEDSSESQLINPSSLLLDGSFVTARNVATFQNGASATPSKTELERYDRLFFDFPDSNSEPAISKSPSIRSSIPSLHALEERLSRCSISVIRHVHSVLRYSSTSSWTSAPSWRSSWLSFGSSTKSGSPAPTEPILLTSEATASPGTTDTAIPKTFLTKLFLRRTNDLPLGILRKPPEYLPLAEQCVWHELIDENQLAIWSGRPVFHPMSLTTRRCSQYHSHKSGSCEVINTNICAVCGILPAHTLATRPRRTFPQDPGALKCWAGQINVGDYFNNRPLHFAAAVLITSADIVRIIKEGGDPQSINTYGATFVHTLFEHVSLEHLLPRYLSLLEYLISINFDFSCRDYHGRTPWHMLFHGVMILGEKELVNLGEAIRLLQPNIDSVDNFGFSIRSYVLKSTNMPRTRINTLLPAFQTPEQDPVDFRNLLNEVSANWQKYIYEILVRSQVCCVDKNGDTPLIALVKRWKYEFDELVLADAIRDMVAVGAEVNVRDRVGNTALAIATRRGLRPAVTTLVDLGASIHCRNYQKAGILKQAHKCLAQAKHVEADKLYSMILSCIVFLADLGATTDIHAYREWGAPWVPLQDLDKACSLFQEPRPEPSRLHDSYLENAWLL